MGKDMDILINLSCAVVVYSRVSRLQLMKVCRDTLDNLAFSVNTCSRSALSCCGNLWTCVTHKVKTVCRMPEGVCTHRTAAHMRHAQY